MIRYQHSDREAANRLFESLTPLLLRYFAANSASCADVEWKVERCWREIRRLRHTYRPASAVLPWILSIAEHTASASAIGVDGKTWELMPDRAGAGPLFGRASRVLSGARAFIARSFAQPPGSPAHI